MHFHINGPISAAIASRAFLSERYGGSSRTLVTKFKAQNPSSNAQNPQVRHVIFPQPGMNPLMPRDLGKGGLLFSNRKEMLSNAPWTVFVPLKDVNGKMKWKYLGEYEFIRKPPMTGAEFATQPGQVRL